MSRRTALAASVVVAAAAGTGVAVAAPSTHTKQAKAPAVFQQHLAEHLGVSADKLTSATEAAGEDTIDELQASGKLDAARASRLKAAVEAGRTTPFARLGEIRRRGGPAGVATQALAQQLGAEVKDVRAKLKAGTTPSALITAAGKDPATVAKGIQALVRTRLEPAVKAGRLDGAKADARAAKAAARLTSDTAITPKAKAARG